MQLNLLYHEITDHLNESGITSSKMYRYTHSLRVFERHLRIASEIRSYGIYDNVHFMFDDGGKSNLQAADLLKKYNFPGTFFICTSFVGKSGFLLEVDIKELSENFVIGSHSHTHPNIFKSLPTRDLNQELSQSKEILQNLIGERVSQFSVPGGDVNQRVHRFAAANDYKDVFTSAPVIFNHSPVTGLKVHPRISIESDTTEQKFYKILTGQIDTRFTMLLKYQTKTLVKDIFRPVYKNMLKKRGLHV